MNLLEYNMQILIRTRVSQEQRRMFKYVRIWMYPHFIAETLQHWSFNSIIIWAGAMVDELEEERN